MANLHVAVHGMTHHDDEDQTHDPDSGLTVCASSRAVSWS